MLPLILAYHVLFSWLTAMKYFYIKSTWAYWVCQFSPIFFLASLFLTFKDWKGEVMVLSEEAYIQTYCGDCWRSPIVTSEGCKESADLWSLLIVVGILSSSGKTMEFWKTQVESDIFSASLQTLQTSSLSETVFSNYNHAFQITEKISK